MTFAAVILPAACGPGSRVTPAPLPLSSPSPSADQPTTILFAVYDQDRATYGNLIEIFEEENPDLRVQMVSIDNIMAQIPRGTREQADELAWRLAQMADVIDQIPLPPGFARDLTPFIEADADFQPSDFWPNVLDFYQWDGCIWTLPLKASFTLIYYDKDAFDAAGLSYPTPGWTWEDFRAKAIALTVREGGTVARWGFVPPWGRHLVFVEGRVGPLIDFTAIPPAPHFNRPEVIEAVQWYTNLYLRDQVAPVLAAPDQVVRLVDERRAAMWADISTQWWWHSQRWNVGVVPFPADTSDSATTPIWVWGVSMSAGTPHPDAAWRWMNFLSRRFIPPARSLTPEIPARRSVAADSALWDRFDGELAATLRYAADHSYGTRFGGRSSGYGAFERAIETILSGEKPVEEAMVEAQTEAIVEIQRGLSLSAQATPVPPFAVASPGEQKLTEVTITFVPGLELRDVERYRGLAEQFHATHPDVIVRIEALPSSDAPYEIPNVAVAADCFLWPPRFQDVDRAAILDLQPFFDTAPPFPAADFYPSVLAQFTWQGDMWGLPAELALYVVEYNKAMFDAAGVSYPTLGWTYEDFLARAVALTRGEGEEVQYGFVPEPFADYALPLILERWGADLVDERQRPPALTLDSPTTVAALRRYTDLALVHRVQPVLVPDLDQPGGEALTEWESLIRNGRAAMWTVSSSWSAYLHQGWTGDIGVVPLPAGGGRDGYVQIRGYFISAQSRAPQACWEWLKFLTGQPEAVEGLPARRSVAESQAYRQQVGDERADAYLAAVADVDPHAFTLTAAQHPWLHGVEYWLFRAYVQAVRGETSVEAALGEAQRLADAYRACVISRDALYEREGWEACLREVDPTLPEAPFGAEE